MLRKRQDKKKQHKEKSGIFRDRADFIRFKLYKWKKNNLIQVCYEYVVFVK